MLNANYSIAILLWVGVIITPTFCISGVLKDSIDIRIEQKLDYAIQKYYYTNFDSASYIFDQQAAIAARHGRWHLALEAKTNKAKCASYHSQLQKMDEAIQEADVWRKTHKASLDSLDKDRSHRSQVDFVQGMYFYALGDFNRAITSFETVIMNNEKYKGLSPQAQFSTYSFIGYSYFQLMLYDKAYLNYEQALVSLLNNKDSNTDYQQALTSLYKGQCKEYKAQHYLEMDQAHEALLYYRKALNLLQTGKENIQHQKALTSAHLRMANAYKLIDNYDSAAYYLKASFAFHSENDPLRFSSYVDFGDLYKKVAKHDKALIYYEKAIGISEKIYPEKHYRKSIPLFKKGEVQLLKEQYEDALQTCQQAMTHLIPGFDTNQDPETHPHIDSPSNVTQLLEGLWLRGRILFVLYEHQKNKNTLEKCIATYQRAIKIISEAQKKYPAAEYKQQLAAKSQPIYEDALEACYRALSNGYTDKDYHTLMFLLLESNKSVMLRNASNNTQAYAYAGIPSELLQKESFLKGFIALTQRKIYQSPNDPQSNAWKKELYKKTLAYDSLLRKIQHNYPVYYQLQYEDRLLTLSELKENLQRESMLLEFFWGDRALFVMGINTHNAVVKRIPIDDALRNDVRVLIQKISSNGEAMIRESFQSFSEVSYSLYTKLVAPVLEESNSQHLKSLIIVPDGLLSYLPFDVLLTAPTYENSFTTLPYLLNNYSIRNLFAASFISPDNYSKKHSYSYAGFAPQYRHDNLPSAIRGEIPPGILTHNVQEVTDAAQYFSGKTFLKDEATEQAFKQVAGTASVLHLSMHAFTNDRDPSFSGLLFSAPENAEVDAEEDGLLHLYELYNLSLHSELAVLSACETGAGHYARGEGIISLGRAFRYAGCNNIVMSLWKVNDKSTADIMKLFFRNLENGLPKDEALRLAKLSFITTPGNKHFAHPYYWSAFTLSGDDVPLQRPLSVAWVIGATIGLFLLSIIVLYRKSLKSSIKN